MGYSVYIHIPFCKHRCSYCDFNTYTGMESLIPEYVNALCREIQYLSNSSGVRLPVHTIYFGGGTPSLLSTGQVENILIALDSCFDLQPDFEATMEANPGTLSFNQLQSLHKLGINRLSLGMQSANPVELTLLGRIHNLPQVTQSMKWARKAGFNNLSLDLIFGLPEQSMETWMHSLNLVLDWEPEHLSLYALTLEEGTALCHWVERGLITRPESDLAAEMYEWATEILSKYNYAQYEISNWAMTRKETTEKPSSFKDSFACRHNLQYWRNLPYLGFGAGAHGYASNLRTSNVASPSEYINRLSAFGHQSPTCNRHLVTTHHQFQDIPRQNIRFPATLATQETVPIDIKTEIGETMMMGLRLTEEGVSRKVFHQRFGQTLFEIYGKQIHQLTNMGLLELAGKDKDVLRLTPKGRLLGNRVFVEFL